MFNKFVILLCMFGSNLARSPPPECLEGPKTTKKFADCCKFPETIDDAIFEKCEKDFPRPQTPGPKKGCCMSECVLNATGILVNKVIDKAVAEIVFTAKLTNGTEKKIVKDALEYCIKEGANMKDDFDEMAKDVVPGEVACNMISGFMIGCVHGQIYKNCPADKYSKDVADCVTIKSYVDKCGFLQP